MVVHIHVFGGPRPRGGGVAGCDRGGGNAVPLAAAGRRYLQPHAVVGRSKGTPLAATGSTRRSLALLHHTYPKLSAMTLKCSPTFRWWRASGVALTPTDLSREDGC